MADDDKPIELDTLTVIASPPRQGSLNPDVNVISNINVTNRLFFQTEGESYSKIWLTVTYNNGAADFSQGLTADEYNAIKEQHPQLGLPDLSSGSLSGNYSYSPGKTGNTLGKIVGQAPAATTSASEANPAVKPETEEEKGVWSSVGDWFMEQGDNLNEAGKHPWEGTKGAVKGLWNMVPDLATMSMQYNTKLISAPLKLGSGALSWFGQDELAAKTAQTAEIFENVNVDFLRLKMSNKAQEGGDLAFTIASMFTGAGEAKALVKVGVAAKQLTKAKAVAKVKKTPVKKGEGEGGKVKAPNAKKPGPCDHLKKGNGKGDYRGGAHSEMTKPVGDGLDSHHLPAADVSPLSRSAGPAIQMVPSDHKGTSSNGPSHNAVKYRQNIEKLLSEGKWREAMAREIWDIKNINGKKYNEAIKEMLFYFKCLGKNNLLK